MLSAFRNRASDFLLKPIDDTELDIVIHRFYTDMIRRQASDANNISTVKDVDNKLLLYTNTTDFEFVQIRDIGLFQYNHDGRVWEVVVANRKRPIRLKRNTTNNMLLKLNSDFIQVNQKYIINITYLKEVTDNICLFFPPFDKIDYVNVGCFFRKKLIDRFYSL
jgi:two-component system LytT family response regulator